MNRMTSNLSALAVVLAVAGGVSAQDVETEEQFRIRCEASGYTDLDECRKFMATDTIANQVDFPDLPLSDAEEEATEAVDVPTGETLVESPTGIPVVPGATTSQAPSVPTVTSPSGIPVVPAPPAVRTPTGIPVVPIQTVPRP